MKLFIEDDYDALSARAADIFAAHVAAEPTAAYGFATGGTPEGLYKNLLARGTDLSRIQAFNLDEYYPIAADNPQSYAYFMARNLFDAAGVPAANRHIPCGAAADPAAECARYDADLANGLALQILGIGSNGHIGFNEPAECFSKGTTFVELAQSTIDANARYFADANEVPRHAITMGIAGIMKAKRILLLAAGAGKAAILQAALHGAITPRVPASVLQLHPCVTVVADRAAAANL
jgi:glucosamine-6-phosphate deaminase